MIEKTRAVARKYGAKLALVPVAVAALPALAQEETAADQILSAVNGGFSAAETIAVAVVVGLFALWAIKLMWRAR